MDTTTIAIESVDRLDRPLAKSAANLTVHEARCLVDAYYAIQTQRLAATSKVRSFETHHNLIGWLVRQSRIIESQIKRALDVWTDAIPAAKWAKSIIGIGPVLAAGLAANIRIEDAPTVAHIWRFAGLDPSHEWNRGELCPWNPRLKRVAFLIGESFVKVSNHERDYYGRLYAKRKRQEIAANEAGRYAGQARRKLERFNIGKNSDARKWYEQGKLPPAHIHARSRRWTVKLFLAHYHHVAWTLATGTPPVDPYAMKIQGRTGYVAPPNFDGGEK
jgi:hypothetical protein